MRSFALLILASTGLAACGDGAATSTTGGGAGPTTTSGAGGAGPVAVRCEGAPADLTLEGTWAVQGKLALRLKGAPLGAISICPTDQLGESTMLFLVTIKANPADATELTEIRASLCALELPSVSALVGTCDPQSSSLLLAQMKPTQALAAAFPKVENAPVTGKLSGKTKGARLDLQRFVVTIGSSKETLPRWNDAKSACADPKIGHGSACEESCVDDCASLRDDDGDTFPGVTLEVCGLSEGDRKSGVACHATAPDEPGSTLQGKAFLNMKVNPRFYGQAQSSCEVKGTIDTETDVLYQIIGTDIYLAGAPISVVQALRSLPSFSVDSASSRFRMVRIDGKYQSPSLSVDASNPAEACATIQKRINEL